MTPRRAIEPDPDHLLSAALAFADRGVPVFPCAPGAKHPLTTHGLHDATLDTDRIHAWWRRSPTANLAVPTGSPHGTATFDILDVDVRPAGSGFPALAVLGRAGLLAGVQQTVMTPSYGEHLYFIGSGQPSGRLPDQYLDFKANGGYVLTPPSVVNGQPYQLLRETPGPKQALTWEPVRAVLTPDQETLHAPTYRPQMTSNIDVLAAWVAKLPEGQRNTGTFWAACRATEAGHTDLTPIINGAVRAGLPLLEATRTVTSAIRRGPPCPSPGRATRRLRPRRSPGP